MVKLKGRRAVIVGAGIGGLAAALDLAALGADVLVLERDAGPGGKARPIDVGGALVDAGPTVLTLRWVFEELFARAGAELGACVALEPMHVLARPAWPDGARLDLFADRARSAEAIASFAGDEEAARFVAFAEAAERTWAVAKRTFVLGQRPSLADLFRRARGLGLGALADVDAHRTLWTALGARLGDPRLRQLFARYATYCGASPFEAPATYALVAHVEAEGVWRVRGGISALARALEARARDLGVRFVYDAHVDEVLVGPDGAARGVRVGGERVAADAVVVNADVSALGSGLLGVAAARAAAPTRPKDRSLSAITWAMVARPRGWSLAHHNVAFSSDYRAEFDDLIARGRAPEAPTVYVCAQYRGDGVGDGDGARDAERALVVVNAPATGDERGRWDREEVERCERAMVTTLERCGLELQPRASVCTTPADWARRFPGTGGAIYGPRPRGALSGLSRAGARTRVRGLYTCGGSAHPGAGVPMVALSGRLAVEAIAADLASTGPSPRAATSGTTSTS